MSRHDARVLTLQVLYEADVARRGASDILSRHLSEVEGLDDEREYVSNLVSGVSAHLAELDERISQLAPDFPVDQLAVIDRNILRIALYEIQHGSVPVKVAINEAVDLAKEFGGETSSRFVNGVLGAAVNA